MMWKIITTYMQFTKQCGIFYFLFWEGSFSDLSKNIEKYCKGVCLKNAFTVHNIINLVVWYKFLNENINLK